MQKIFLNQNIEKLCKNNKAEMLRLFELVTYLVATKEISLQDAQGHINTILNVLEE